MVVSYESIKRELKTRPIYECRCDERLKTKTEDLHVSHTLGFKIGNQWGTLLRETERKGRETRKNRNSNNSNKTIVTKYVVIDC